MTTWNNHPPKPDETHHWAWVENAQGIGHWQAPDTDNVGPDGKPLVISLININPARPPMPDDGHTYFWVDTGPYGKGEWRYERSWKTDLYDYFVSLGMVTAGVYDDGLDLANRPFDLILALKWPLMIGGVATLALILLIMRNK